MQEVSDTLGVIECGLLSGLPIAALRKPLADMVISGSDPNLFSELIAPSPYLVILIQICSIILPIWIVDVLTPPSPALDCPEPHLRHAAAASTGF